MIQENTLSLCFKDISLLSNIQYHLTLKRSQIRLKPILINFLVIPDLNPSSWTLSLLIKPNLIIMNETTLTRQELYDLVWKEPLSRLAQRYNMSDNGLRKICKRMNIPLPAMGHWQKIQYGKKVMRLKLPKEYQGKDEIKLNEGGKENVDSPLIKLRKRIKDIEDIFEKELRVPERLTKPDNLVQSTIDYHDAIKKYYRTHHGSYPTRDKVLSITVSENNESRGLRIMDTIIKILRKRKHEVVANHWETYAEFNSEKVKFRIREKHMVSDKKDSHGGRILESTGELVFVIDRGSYDRKEVIDGYEKLENKISTIVAMVELEGEKMIEDSIRWEIERKEAEERKRIEREFRERQDKELKAFKDLFLQAIRVHHANILRNYLSMIESNSVKAGTCTEEFRKWVEWANHKISWYDPLINESDPLLEEQHKTRLFNELLKNGSDNNPANSSFYSGWQF